MELAKVPWLQSYLGRLGRKCRQGEQLVGQYFIMAAGWGRKEGASASVAAVLTDNSHFDTCCHFDKCCCLDWCSHLRDPVARGWRFDSFCSKLLRDYNRHIFA